MQGSTVRQASAVLTGTASGVGHDRFMVNSSPPLLDILSQTLAAELALPDPATATVIVARLLVAIVLGGQQ